MDTCEVIKKCNSIVDRLGKHFTPPKITTLKFSDFESNLNLDLDEGSGPNFEFGGCFTITVGSKKYYFDSDDYSPHVNYVDDRYIVATLDDNIELIFDTKTEKYLEISKDINNQKPFIIIEEDGEIKISYWEYDLAVLSYVFPNNIEKMAFENKFPRSTYCIIKSGSTFFNPFSNKAVVFEEPIVDYCRNSFFSRVVQISPTCSTSKYIEIPKDLLF